MAIIRTKIFPVEGQSPIVLQGVPQSIELVGDITGDKGTNEVWEDTKRIEDFEVKITTLDEYSTGVPHKVVKRVDTLDTTSKTWTEGTRETYEAQEEEFTLNYKGHERDFEVKIDSEESKAFIKYRWGRNDAHDLTVEKDITITERPTPVEPEEGGGGSEELKPMMFMGKEGTGDDTWLYFAVLKEYLFDDDEYGKCFKIMNGASTTYSSCDTLQSCEGCPYMDECKYTDFLKPFLNSHPEYDGVCMGDGLWFPITLYDPKTEKPVYTALTEMPEEGGDSDDGDAWGYPIVDAMHLGMHYRISVPDELKGKELTIRTDVQGLDTPVYTGEELKDSMYHSLAVEDDEYYASFNGISAFGKPSEWWFACYDENTGELVDTDYRVEIPSDEPKMSTTEVTSVTFDKSKITKVITPTGAEASVMVVPFPYKQGYPILMLEGIFFKETIESMKIGDFNSAVVGMPCSILDNFSELGFSMADCLLNYNIEPDDGSTFHYLFANMETWKFGYFDDNGDFVEVEINL